MTRQLDLLSFALAVALLLFAMLPGSAKRNRIDPLLTRWVAPGVVSLCIVLRC